MPTPPRKILPPHLDSHGTTDIKPAMLSGVQTGNETPCDKNNVSGIAHACTKMIFSCKDDQCKALRIYIGVGARDLYIDEAHMALGIFCFVVFFQSELKLTGVDSADPTQHEFLILDYLTF